MIECTDKYIYYKRKRKKVSKFSLALFFIVFVFIIVFLFYKLVVAKNIYNICYDYAKSISAKAVNQAVISTLIDGLEYDDLVYVEKNNAGDIILMSTNSLKVNKLSRNIVNKTESNLNREISNGVPIPLLTFFGFEVLSGYGKIINYKAIHISSVNCKFVSNFKSVGINQTLHSIYADVLISINLESLFNNKEFYFNSPVLISEAVLVGRVPEVYLNGKLFG